MTNIATIGGGCFWCLDALYRQVNGVLGVVSGYSGGTVDNPTMDMVYAGGTGQAEVVQITFDSSIITYREILEIFYAIHDPTTVDRQGNDVGDEYRSIILYADDEQKAVAEDVTANYAATHWDDPIVTQLVPLEKFWPADEAQQDYFMKNQTAGYCQIIINPKLQKFKKEFASKLRPHVPQA
jgi:peptide-methionine (S)-S-oxide reductase